MIYKFKKKIVDQLHIINNNLPIKKYKDYKFYRPTYAITVPEIKDLKGKRIRTTLPNIVGTVTATVGEYNSSTNRVELRNIVSDRTGVKYGNLSYLPEEVAGLQVLPKDQEPDHGPKDCTITGGKGRYIDSGEKSISNTSIKYTIHQCEIEIIVKVPGVAPKKYVINSNNRRIRVILPTSPVTRVRFLAWIDNKELWVEIVEQRRVRFGRWQRIGRTRIKLGTWPGIKI